MIPRRFYALSVFCSIALLFVFFFHLRSSEQLAVPANLLDGSRNGFQQGLVGESDSRFPAQSGDGESLTGGNDVKPPQWSDTAPPTVASTLGAGTKDGGLRLPSPKPTLSSFLPGEKLLPARIRVALVDTSGYNEEVAAGFMYAVGTQKSVELAVYMLQDRHGIGEIVNDFDLTHPLVANKSSAEFAEVLDAEPPHLVIATTCENDLEVLEDTFAKLLKKKSTYLFCVIHRPARWQEEDLTSKIRPWLDEQLVDFVTLSYHTAHHLRNEIISEWDFNASVTVRHMAPIFPVVITDTKALQPNDAGKSQYPMAIYGDHDSSRHNYSDTWTNFEAARKTAENVTYEDGEHNITHEDRALSLHILGEHRPPNVPKQMKPHLHIATDISFRKQYEILSQAFILLPAFNPAQPDYVSSLASWSIPAALIAGVPPAADDRLLQSYAYLPRDAVWPRNADETDMSVVQRVIVWSAEEHVRKRKAVGKARDGLLSRNAELMRDWIEIAVRRLGRARWREAAAAKTKLHTVEDFYRAIGAATPGH